MILTMNNAVNNAINHGIPQSRALSSSTTDTATTTTTTTNKMDMIGSPDPISCIRPVQYYRPANETDTEKAWREQRERIDQAHHTFWYHNNQTFERARHVFTQQIVETTGKPPTDQDMDKFYCQFY
ncbi:hypothetical protein BDF22DRAFT_95712 [Syncephalis plumigaleata]|nr:hypothetical protein BDF22DRAFT_95712 [Syncephalis plumigaleata]